VVLLLKIIGNPFFDVSGFAHVYDITPVFRAVPEYVAAGKMRK
jgi:hypothetical protein